jgi:hypothetical protein
MEMILWGNTYESTLKSLILLQKRAERGMTFSKYDEHTSSLFKNLGLLKLSDLIIFTRNERQRADLLREIYSQEDRFRNLA